MIRVEGRGGVRILWLESPPVNALDAAMYDRLASAFSAFEADPGCRSVIVASALAGIFMAGADLKEFPGRDRSPAALKEHLDRIHRTFDSIATASMPVVAAIEGHALGGGCEMALCCDFRFMGRGRPRIGLPEVGLGLMPGGGGTQRLARLVGRTAASRLAFLGQRLDADEAAGIGLVESVPEGQAFEAALELANRLAEQAPSALRRIKRALVGGLAGTLETGLALERQLAAETSGSDEALEGVQAFLEKRLPGWKLRD